MLLVHLFDFLARVTLSFPLHLGVEGWLRLMIVPLPGLFYLNFLNTSLKHFPFCDSHSIVKYEFIFKAPK